jgi:hypothetical protein
VIPAISIKPENICFFVFMAFTCSDLSCFGLNRVDLNSSGLKSLKIFKASIMPESREKMACLWRADRQNSRMPKPLAGGWMPSQIRETPENRPGKTFSGKDRCQVFLQDVNIAKCVRSFSWRLTGTGSLLNFSGGFSLQCPGLYENIG